MQITTNNLSSYPEFHLLSTACHLKLSCQFKWNLYIKMIFMSWPEFIFPYINVHSVKIKIICCIMHLSFKRTTPNILFFHSYIQFILYFLHSHRLNFKIFCSYFFCLHIKSILKCLSSYSFMVFFIALFSSSKNKKKENWRCRVFSRCPKFIIQNFVT